MRPLKYFWTPYAQYAEREGQPFKVLHRIADVDEEVGKMYLIEFPDGEKIFAWEEEVDSEVAVTVGGKVPDRGPAADEEIEVLVVDERKIL